MPLTAEPVSCLFPAPQCCPCNPPGEGLGGSECHICPIHTGGCGPLSALLYPVICGLGAEHFGEGLAASSVLHLARDSMGT